MFYYGTVSLIVITLLDSYTRCLKVHKVGSWCCIAFISTFILQKLQNQWWMQTYQINLYHLVCYSFIINMYIVFLYVTVWYGYICKFAKNTIDISSTKCSGFDMSEWCAVFIGEKQKQTRLCLHLPKCNIMYNFMWNYIKCDDILLKFIKRIIWIYVFWDELLYVMST